MVPFSKCKNNPLSDLHWRAASQPLKDPLSIDPSWDVAIMPAALSSTSHLAARPLKFAFVENASEFYTSTYPVVSAGKETKVIITSTANGIGNIFCGLWEGAQKKKNEFTPFRVDWWDVPGRDEKWKLETISNTSQLQFDQEFGNTFFGTGNTLIEGQVLLDLRAREPIHRYEGGDLLVYQEPIEEHQYIMTVDVCQGRGQDYSTFNIIDVSVQPFKQVCVYRNNRISPILYPNIIYKYATIYNEAYVVVENNDQGMVVCVGLYQDLEYENIHLESAVKADAIGIRMDRKVKRIGCSSIKDIIEGHKLDIVDENTIMEISTFVSRGTSFEASDGNHDDLMMNLVMFGYFVGTQSFGNVADVNIKQMLFDQRMKEIEDDIPPFGIIDDGSDYIPTEDRYDPYSTAGWNDYEPDLW